MEKTRIELEEELNSYDWSSKDFRDSDLKKLLDYIKNYLFS